MKTEQLVKKISAIPAGRFFRIRYLSKVKIKAEFEKQGISIFKIVDTTTRTGVKYSSLIDQHKMNELPAEEKKSNWQWVVKDRIKKNLNTGKDYLVIAPIKNGNTKTSYIFTTPEGISNTVNIDVVKDYAVKSYFKTDKPTIVNVTLDNVLMVK